MTQIAVIATPTPRISARPLSFVAVLLAGAAAVVVGASGTLPQWGPGRPSTHPMKVTDARAVHPPVAGLDAGSIADSLRHRVVPMPGHLGTLVATDARYRAMFDGAGFSLAPDGSSRELRLSLQTASRGGRDLGLNAGAWTASRGGAERPVASHMHELVTLRSGEVEWDVIVAAVPAGRGDLVFTAGTTGSTRIVSEGDGLRVSLAGGGHVRVGALVVKDATGRVLHRTVPAVVGRHLRLVVPGRVLAGARYPLTLDPTVGPEKTVVAGNHLGTESGIAFDGTNYLVVWADGRSGSFDIYGARVRPDGTVLDPGGFPVSAAAGDQTVPVVAYYGPNYLVVWQDGRHGTTNIDIYASTVTTGGRVIDTGGAAFSVAPGNQLGPQVSFNGTSALVVWTDLRSGVGGDIYGSRWNSTSGLQDLAGLPISTAPNDQYTPAASYYGPDYLVVWADQRNGSIDIYATRVTTAGVTLDTAGVPFSTAPLGQSQPALAFDGTYELVVWKDSRSDAWFDIYGARWDPASGLVDPGGLPICTVSGDKTSPKVAVNNGGFLVLWQDSRLTYRVFGTRFADNGTVTDPGGFPISTGALPAVTHGGGKWVTSYERSGDIFFTSIAPK